MFLDSILGIPSQIIGTIGGLANNIIAIPGQLVGTVTGSINTVSNTAGNTLGSVVNTAGQTVQGIASTATNLLSSPKPRGHHWHWNCPRDLTQEVNLSSLTFFSFVIKGKKLK